ncbi:hypothetical protein JAAARDRAFT_436728 [Jaapia argillacea MUCL 33604]|uniref:Uncharacterized protein n=1 Tax=Jaapia argillacea MUCL 33604 TaxID=933084 RepID=A0A067PEG0_9AGAM|nr:hypothetical protein JAAARDRAFT_436728 [Jaapia argillacea MUCL 33604]
MDVGAPLSIFHPHEFLEASRSQPWLDDPFSSPPGFSTPSRNVVMISISWTPSTWQDASRVLRKAQPIVSSSSPSIIIERSVQRHLSIHLIYLVFDFSLSIRTKVTQECQCQVIVVHRCCLTMFMGCPYVCISLLLCLTHTYSHHRIADL